ncbi:MAG TPA: hypothetical protein VNZ94_05535 [Xanthobacteraceae bacterium]|nr:hypothetical protein [Xanthobacteraceae bacterium]
MIVLPLMKLLERIRAIVSTANPRSPASFQTGSAGRMTRELLEDVLGPRLQALVATLKQQFRGARL